jgi:MFS family permease
MPLSHQRDEAPSRFAAVLAARAVSSLGDGLAVVAFPLLATQLTHNAVLIAGAAFATRLPWLLFALPAGAVADRVDRRRLLAGVEIIRMVALALLGVAIVSGHAALGELYAAAFVIATCETLFDAATMAVVPALVEPAGLEVANSRLFLAQTGFETFIGPAIGGVVFALAASAPFLADGLSFAASAAFLSLALRHWTQPARPAPDAVEPVVRRLASDVREGIGWFVQEPTLRLAVGLVTSFAFCQSLGLPVIIIYTIRTLHLSTAGYGLFTAVTAVGYVVGGWLAPRVTRRLGTGTVLLAAGLLAGACYAAIGLTASLPIAVAGFVGEAVAVAVGNIASLSLRQRVTPLEMAGRVSSAARASCAAAAAAATLLGGVLVLLGGPGAPFAIGGLLQIAVALVLGTRLVARLRVTGPPQGVAAPAPSLVSMA